MADPDDIDHRTRIALFRHGLVGALLDLERGELKAALDRVCRRTYTFPNGGRRRVSLATLKRWLKALREGGFQALKPTLRGDYGVSRAIPEVWLKKAIALRREVPTRTALVLVEILRREPDCPTLNAHTLDGLLRRRGMTRRLMGKKSVRRRRWTAEHVNAIWQGDSTPGLWLPDPRDPNRYVQTKLFLWLDDVSRLVPHAEFYFDEQLPRMERSLKIAICRRGVPSSIYVDNGSVFRANQFAAAMAEMEIRKRHSRAYTPQGRGKIERIFGVLQEHFYPEAKAAGITVLADLNEALAAWLECIYHERVHSDLKATPLQVYRAGLGHVRPADPVKVARAFLWRYIRKVSGNGFISLLANSYSVDPSWSGQELELRLDPFDLSRIDVYRDRRPVARAHVRQLKKASLLEIQPLVAAPPTEPSGISFLDGLRQEHRQKLAREIGLISMHKAIRQEEK